MGTRRFLWPQPDPSIEADVQTVLAGFRAADPRYQSHCTHALNNSRPSWEPTKGAQFEQDVYVWRNLFAAESARGRKGFYVESGANAPRAGSNTWFFDRCLGWRGLCIEADVGYIAPLREARSCTVVNQCLSDKPGNLTYVRNGVGGHIGTADDPASAKRITVQCNRLEAILDEYADSQRVVDFWSLDVEGHERAVLGSADLKRLRVRALLVEDDKISHRELDRDVTAAGYIKLAQLIADSLYVRPDTFERLPWPLFQPRHFHMLDKRFGDGGGSGKAQSLLKALQRGPGVSLTEEQRKFMLMLASKEV